MRLQRFIPLLVLAAAASGRADAAPQPTGTLWSNGRASLDVTACSPSPEHDLYCRAIALRHDGREERIGEGYVAVDLLWKGRRGADGPDLMVRGLGGGSGGRGDLFALDTARARVLRKLSYDYAETVRAATVGGRPRLDVPFGIGFFNGAPHAGTTLVRLPLVWSGGDFRLDRAALARRSFDAADRALRELAMREELSRWASDAYPAETLYPPEAGNGTPVTAQALADLMLSGHAGLARAMLHRAWPAGRDGLSVKLGGEEAFWSGLCRAIVRNAAWRLFALDRIPDAGIIIAAAAPDGHTAPAS